MSEDAWRRKKYYPTRILIPIEQLQPSALGDVMICLSGEERDLLQNLLAYADRRSTFVSEYHDSYYLAPDEDEWDWIQGIVAELKERLMDCGAFTAQLEEMLALAQAQQAEPYLGNYYRDLADDGVITYTLPDGEVTPIEGERCAVAQLVWAFQYELLVETIQPLQEFLLSILLPAVLGILTTAVGGPILGLSAAAFTAYAIALLDMGVESDLENVENELVSLKQDLVCAMYSAWQVDGTYIDAAAAAAAIINASTVFSPIDKLLMRRGFSPLFMERAQEAWDSESAWATGNVQAGYCDGCGIPEGWRTDAYDFTDYPHDPQGWEISGTAFWSATPDAVCSSTHYLGLPTSTALATRVVQVPGDGDDYELAIDYYARGDQYGEHAIRVDGSANEDGPWTALFTADAADLPEGECVSVGFEKHVLDLSSYNYLQYKVSGLGLTQVMHLFTIQFAWSLPE